MTDKMTVILENDDEIVTWEINNIDRPTVDVDYPEPTLTPYTMIVQEPTYLSIKFSGLAFKDENDHFYAITRKEKTL